MRIKAKFNTFSIFVNNYQYISQNCDIFKYMTYFNLI